MSKFDFEYVPLTFINDKEEIKKQIKKDAEIVDKNNKIEKKICQTVTLYELLVIKKETYNM